MFDKRKDASQEGSRAHFESGISDQSAKQSQSEQRTAQASGRTAVIGPRIRIDGDVSGEENLVIEGEVKGSVNLKQYRVEIGPSGRVRADIDAKVVKVDGTVEGDIVASEMATISRTGNIRGNIKAPRMTLEDGAKFKGSIDMDPEESSRAEAKSASKPAASSKPPEKPEVEKSDATTTGNGAVPVSDKSKAEQGLSLKN